jgi:hypothetical protein
VLRHLRADREVPREAEATYPLSGVHQGQQITLRYPAYWDDLEERDRASLSEWQAAHLDLSINGWFSDDKSHALAREMGAFLVEFVDNLALSGLSQPTIERHAKNCWWIGWLACRYGGVDHFAPALFSGEPKFLAEFEGESTASAAALSSYQVTWRKLARYVDSLEQV